MQHLFLNDPVAVIGASCRLPGDVRDMRGLWELLENGTDAVTRMPADRFSKERFFSKSPGLPGHCYTDAAGVLSSIREFDPGFFGLSRKEAADMDPQQRLMLELTWEALEAAGIPPSSLRGSDTGVFIGASNMDFTVRGSMDPESLSPHSMTGSALSIIANRVSYIFDFHGPSFVVDTACSSSLAALYDACRSVGEDGISLAVAGGVNILMSPLPFIGFAEARMLSPDGRCKMFDASGNGFVRAEGGGVVVLKKLSRALRDGDPVMALVAGVGMNADGRTTGLPLPGLKAQTDLLRGIYEYPGIDKSKVAYIEAHGTGTAAGDPVEARAVGEVLGKALKGRRPLYIGSVKTNVGHLEPASGTAGLLKAVLVLQHGRIPPNLHFTVPNPHIDFDTLNLRVPTQALDLPLRGDGTLVGLNSFGFGGANVHVLLRKAPQRRKQRSLPPPGDDLPLLLSARSEKSLRAFAVSLADHLEQTDEGQLPDIARTLALCRDHQRLRAVFNRGGMQDLTRSLRAFGQTAHESGGRNAIGEAVGENCPGAFVFSGNGGQWPGMGGALFKENAAFAQALEEIDACFRTLRNISLIEVMRNPEKYPRAVSHTEESQPLLFAVQTGLVRALRAKGIRPDCVFGHSVGEIAAACAAEALSVKDACTVVHFRSLLQSRLRDTGHMAVAAAGKSALEELLAPFGGEVEVTAVNSEKSVTLGGGVEAVRACVQQLKKKGIAAKLLDLPYPFHTRRIDVLKDEFLAALKDLRPRTTIVPFLSTAGEGEVLRPGRTYWWKNMRNRVCFGDAVSSALEKGCRIFLEIGPHPVLLGYIQEGIGKSGLSALAQPVMQRNGHKGEHLEAAWREAWKKGWKLRRADMRRASCVRSPLPAYAWDREYLWAADSPECRGFITAPNAHPLLGRRLPRVAPGFENLLALADHPRLADHRIGGALLFPAACIIEMFLTAAEMLHPEERRSLERLVIYRPLRLSPENAVSLRLLEDEEDGALRLESRPYMSGEGWSLCAAARTRGAPPAPEAGESVADSAGFGVAVSADTIYAEAAKNGFAYGPSFRTLETVRMREEGDAPAVFAALLPAPAEAAAGMRTPPVLLDGGLHALLPLLSGGGPHARQPVPAGQEHPRGTMFLPSAVACVTRYAAGSPRFVRACLRSAGKRQATADLDYLDAGGNILLSLEQCRFRKVDRPADATPAAFLVKAVPAPVPPGLPGAGDAFSCDTRAACRAAGAALELSDRDVSDHKGIYDKIHTGGNGRPEPRGRRLLRYTALKQAHEAVNGLLEGKGAGRFTADELRACGALDPEQEVWLFRIMRRLVEAGLARAYDDGWELLYPENVPAAEALWRTAVAGAPGHLPESVLLARVTGRAGDLLRSGAAARSLPDSLFSAYFSLSPALRPYINGFNACIEALSAGGGPGGIVRILLLSAAPTAFAGELVPHLRGKDVHMECAGRNDEERGALEQILASVPEASAVYVDLAAPRPEPAGDRHIIAAAFRLHTETHTLSALKSCRGLLAPGGVLCLLEHGPDVVADLTFGADPRWWRASSGERGRTAGLHSPEAWRSALQEAGFTDIERVAAPDGDAGPAFLLLARNGGGNAAGKDSGCPERAEAGSSLSPAAGRRGSGPKQSGEYVSPGVSAENAQAPRRPLPDFVIAARGPDTPSGRLGIALLEELRARGAHTLLLHAGHSALSPGVLFDPLSPAPWRELLAATPDKLLELVNLLGYDTEIRPEEKEFALSLEYGPAATAAFAAAWDASRRPAGMTVVTGGAVAAGMDRAELCPEPGVERDRAACGTPTDIRDTEGFHPQADGGEGRTESGTPAAAAGLSILPSQGALWGFGRVLVNEMPALRTKLLDWRGSSEEIGCLARELVDAAGTTDDREILLSGRGRFTLRLVPAVEGEEVAGPCGARLVFDTPGSLKNLYWRKSLPQRPGPGRIRIAVRAVGLNFRDVMWSKGLLPEEALENGFAGAGLGMECSGVVLEAGEGVSGFKPGDEVFGFVPDAFSTEAITDAGAVAVKPAGMTFTEAAAVPVAFMTAWYGMAHLAGMRAGESVLIHGAAGGVGLAAVQIAAHLGVEVFATAGSEEKRTFLRGLGLKNIFSSRSTDFARQIPAVTAGRGVDVVLNSLSGEFIAAGLAVLKPFGRFLELGKRDFYADSPLRMQPFSRNLSFFGIDVDGLFAGRRELAGKLFTGLTALFDEGRLRPLPHVCYPRVRAVDAFRAMQHSTHIGKLVVLLDDAETAVRPLPLRQGRLSLRRDAAYLVTGGTGGFGLAAARRMARRGAGHLILMSRSGVKDAESAAVIEEMRNEGVDVAVLKVDVSSRASLARALRETADPGIPLAGVVHAAAVLDDGLIAGLTLERIRKVLAAKSVGAWNLHELTKDAGLDFFVLFSSATTTFGNPGQASYVAANAALESLAAYRRQSGLPAVVIGWGPVSGGGMLQRNPKVAAMLKNLLGAEPIGMDEALDRLEQCLVHGIADSHYFCLSRQGGPGMALLSSVMLERLVSAGRSGADGGKPPLDRLRSAPPEEGRAFLTELLRADVADILGISAERLAPDTPLADEGMDSLMAAELGVSIDQKFDLDGYAVPLTDKMSTADLAAALYPVIMERGAKNGAGGDDDLYFVDALSRQHALDLPDSVKREISLSLGGARHG
ncbi:MAG: SDR family NAD(P)-dependent oxidoreductase [Desulfovibrio sp.]|jgi:acyl transferase domain-containing protein/NADPH:quinone reductase-like Zn-dependent oxidoreductase/acyl carrier protein|nr:SDR family NAD(P)-dependent oxidoreductase [Desulfovibrio sp.]